MYLASRIDNLSRVVLILILDHLAEGILDSRVVTVDKVSVDELHRHTRLACSFGSVCCLLVFACEACASCTQQSRTDGSAADNGHLSLLWWGRHLVVGFGRRS